MTTETLTDRELDAWLAEHLLGRVPCTWGFLGDETLWCEPHGFDSLWNGMHTNQAISSTGDGMLLVLEAMREHGWRLHTASFVSIPVSQAIFTTSGDVYPPPEAIWIQADTLPRAVAEAAKAALEEAL